MLDNYGSFTRERYETDQQSLDPHRDVIDRVWRDQEKMLFADVEPRELPRGEAIEAKNRLIEAIAKKLGIDREYDAWLQARRRQADKMAEFFAEGEESKPAPYTFGPMPSGEVGSHR
ncbi:hypothetical protein DMB42_35560 [Nonomuraea sp. WAC 01424]|uniref:hypothetical protein n=1 Tax=Nonomuraea sp. WAC 01424 TaxID=2203200 RepID=UPI000F7AC2B3|nr:hypothetical protein [Nonomuraea sp. WAC 01424]RSN03146.1 hypothetical protein DMB42_35560 [Nonomuraea sp. WAC 01424]